jgi:hypothetical protein
MSEEEQTIGIGLKSLEVFEKIAEYVVRGDMFPKAYRKMIPHAYIDDQGKPAATMKFSADATKSAITAFLISHPTVTDALRKLAEMKAAEGQTRRGTPELNEFQKRALEGSGAPEEPNFATLKETPKDDEKKNEATPRQKRRSKGTPESDTSPTSDPGQAPEDKGTT